MELKEIIENFQMDTGASCPTIISNDNKLFISFYSDVESLQENSYENEVITLEFISCLNYIYGMPNNETISGHPYYKLGLRSYSFYELINSDLVKNLQVIDSVHPYYNPKKWDSYKHYILTFHDKMFQCISKEYQIQKSNLSLYDQSLNLLQGIL